VAKPELIFIYVTCPDLKTAEHIAEILIQKKLVACGNILPEMKSLYRWKGRMQADNEAVLILKTRKSLFKKSEKAILRLHPYDCPCIVALPIAQVNTKYAKWIFGET